MLQLALRTLRFRAGTFIAAFVAMFFAAAILMACGGLIETGIRTAVEPGALESADIVVAGNQEYYGSGGDVDEPPILPERVRINAALQDSVQALPGADEVHSHIFERSAPQGTIDALGIKAVPGTDVDELRAQIDTLLDDTAVTLVGEERGQAEHGQDKASGTTVMALAGVFTAFALLIAIFGVTSMLALSITQRQRDLALLRAIGGLPQQIRSLIFRETLFLAVIATALAIVPGQVLGRGMFGLLVHEGIASQGMVFRQGWLPTLIAVAIAIVAALAGALGAGRRAALIKPTQALAEASVHSGRGSKGRLLMGAVVLAAGGAMSLVTVVAMDGPMMAATGAPAVLLLAVGFALFSPVLTMVSTFASQWPAHLSAGVTGHLAVLNARGNGGRMAAVMAPVILLTGVSTGLLYLQSTNDAADREAFANTITADAVVEAEKGFAPEQLQQLNALAGIKAASPYVESTGFIEAPDDVSPSNEGWNLAGVSAEAAESITPATLSAGSWEEFGGNSIAIEQSHAEKLGVHPGDSITLRMGDNTVEELTVAGVFSSTTGYDSLLLPADTLAAHITDGFATRVLVSAGAETTQEQLVQSLNGWGSEQGGVEVFGCEVLMAEYDQQKQTANFALHIMVLMVAGYAAITVINTLASVMFVRRREFGVQRLAGATRKQVLTMVGLEGLIISVSGIVFGTLAAMIIVVPVSVQRLGTVVPAGSPWNYILLVALAIVLTLMSMLIPAYRLTRGRPTEAALAVR